MIGITNIQIQQSTINNPICSDENSLACKQRPTDQRHKHSYPFIGRDTVMMNEPGYLSSMSV